MKKFVTILILNNHHSTVVRGTTRFEYESEDAAARAIAESMCESDVLGLVTSERYCVIPVSSILYAFPSEVQS